MPGRRLRSSAFRPARLVVLIAVCVPSSMNCCLLWYRRSLAPLRLPFFVCTPELCRIASAASVLDDASEICARASPCCADRASHRNAARCRLAHLVRSSDPPTDEEHAGISQIARSDGGKDQMIVRSAR
jgi:hypothetical protein